MKTISKISIKVASQSLAIKVINFLLLFTWRSRDYGRAIHIYNKYVDIFLSLKVLGY